MHLKVSLPGWEVSVHHQLLEEIKMQAGIHLQVN